MQSAPFDVFNRPHTVDSFSKAPLSPTQHGHDLYGDNRISGHLAADGGDSSVSSESPAGESPLLNLPYDTQPSPAVDRVSQYENAVFESSRAQSEFGFIVTPSAKQSSQSLDAFPNEVLTHILSHLPPASLSSIALVSRRFHSLVTTPHAWRVAFSRYFPGPSVSEDTQASERLTSDKRYFSRLSALASWRSEYILRTRLLRSLSRGKPGQFGVSKKNTTVRSATVRNGSAIATYTSQLLYPVSHLHGTFGGDSAKKEPLFIHGASEQCAVTASAPSAVKVGTWGLADHNFSRHFSDSFPGEPEYGLGSGNLVGVPNSMDLSQPYGMIYGEGCPQGRAYHLPPTEQRGRFMGLSDLGSHPQLGIPATNFITTAITAVWIAKSSEILKMTGGLVGMLSGSSSGILTAYALGHNPAYEKRFQRGQLTARWVVSPGVPIVSIAVDDNYSPKRYTRRRVWAAVLNALGEVFYLSDLPQQQDNPMPANMTTEDYDRLAWKTGRSVRWELVEVSRRTARPDPFNRELVDGSYSPRSSSDSMKLSDEQIAAETKEIEQFLSFKPKHFRKVCEGWDMRRDLRVDFAGNDGHGAGESLIVIRRGDGENEKATIQRYIRKLRLSHLPMSASITNSLTPSGAAPPSIFGGPTNSPELSTAGSSFPPSRSSGRLDESVLSPSNTEWYISDFDFGGRKSLQVTTSALDLSTYTLLTPDEDLLLMSGISESSSVMSSPLPHMDRPSGSEIPGQRGRYMAVGTATGCVFVWDIRSPTSKNSEVVNSITPIRTIQTDSPQISCVALTSLFLVHGGNDGLVQAWDPLASTTRPIRTINSRFSSRARRRLVQAEASIHGVGNNFYATGAICLDPDPTNLRGMVALGTHLRYWSYSSSAADQYKSNKRRLRYSQRGSNPASGGQRFNTSGRGAIRDQIEDEKSEMERQAKADRKEREHLSNRFGIDLLGPDAGEEELLAYAQLLSQEAYSTEAMKRGDTLESSVVSTSPSDTIGPNDSSFAPDELSSVSSPCNDPVEDDLDPDIAEAIRLSLLEESPSSFEPASPFSVKYTNGSSSSKSTFSPPEPTAAESSRQRELDDLELAIQLSLVENQAHNDHTTQQEEDFPSLRVSSQSPGKNKGKTRMAW